jgi:hypothetical protein
MKKSAGVTAPDHLLKLPRHLPGLQAVVHRPERRRPKGNIRLKKLFDLDGHRLGLSKKNWLVHNSYFHNESPSFCHQEKFPLGDHSNPDDLPAG